MLLTQVYQKSFAAGISLSAGFAVASAIIAGVFILSGSSKIRHPLVASVAMVRFGLLRNVRAWTGLGAGVLELLVGASLLAWPNSVIPYVPATGLLTMFTALIASALLRGERFQCACFGDGGAKLSYVTLLRTFALFGLAGLSLLAVADGFATVRAGDRLLALCTGSLLICLGALIVRIHRTAPFQPRFETGNS